MAGSLLHAFASLDEGTKDSLADLSSPRDLAFATLLLANRECGLHTLTSEHITACLEAAGVTVRKLSIARALANSRGTVSTSKDLSGETQYRLMTRGRREIESVLGGDRMTVVRIESNQPRSARMKLKEILSQFDGLVRICDPYYGVRTLDTLDMIQRTCNVRFLTARTNEAGRRLNGAMTDFKRERPKVEFRLAAPNAGIHDRYILTNSELIILGHGLKDIGGKESFVIWLKAALVTDLVRESNLTFDSRWSQGTPI